MSVEFALRVDEQGHLHIPAEIQRQLFPGMVVVLKLDEQTSANGHAESSGTGKNGRSDSSGPELVEKDGWTVVRGDLPSDFDWNAFLYEDRENRLDLLTEWVRQ